MPFLMLVEKIGSASTTYTLSMVSPASSKKAGYFSKAGSALSSVGLATLENLADVSCEWKT